MGSRNARAKRRCRRKRSYATFAEAMEIVRAAAWSTLFRQQAYRCPTCQKYHVGRIRSVKGWRWKEAVK